jgi:hypothetical protein
VGTVTGLRARQPTNRDAIPGIGNIFVSFAESAVRHWSSLGVKKPELEASHLVTKLRFILSTVSFRYVVPFTGQTLTFWHRSFTFKFYQILCVKCK